MFCAYFSQYSCRRLFVIPFLALTIAVVCSAVRATTLAHMSVAQMSQTAPVIVRARCEENATRWDAGEIWTFTRFAVEDIWKGSAPAEITVRLLGGAVGNLSSTVAGIPRFQPDEIVILFLEPTSHGDFSILSWQQGTFRVRNDARSSQETVTQDTASFATFDAPSRRFEMSGVRNVPIDAVRQQVRAALSATPIRRQP
jgi:hypothetical protein